MSKKTTVTVPKAAKKSAAVKTSAPAEVKKRAHFYPTAESAAPDKGRVYFLKPGADYGYATIPPQGSSSPSIAFEVSGKLVNSEGKAVDAMFCKSEREGKGSACVIRGAKGELIQGYIAKSATRQPVTRAHRAAQPKDRAPWEAENHVAKGAMGVGARKEMSLGPVPLFFVS